MRIQRKDRERRVSKESGKYSIRDISNENGNLLGQFATRNGLKIKSTTFPHRSIHLTLKVPGSHEVNQIDHVLVSLKQATSITDVKSSREPRPLLTIIKTKVRDRIVRIQKLKEVNPKWDVRKLQKRK
jgi:hypothetical protein